jgi:hypothetical protein
MFKQIVTTRDENGTKHQKTKHFDNAHNAKSQAGWMYANLTGIVRVKVVDENGITLLALGKRTHVYVPSQH